MSPSVAGFAFLLSVCVVSGQYPAIRLKGIGDETSIAVDKIVGGNYPEGSFSIGYGQNNPNGNGGPGADYAYVNPGQNGNNGEFVNGQNDIGGYNPANSQDNGNNTPVKNSASRNRFFSSIWRFIMSWF